MDTFRSCFSNLIKISSHATRAGEKLRSQQSICGAIQVSIRTGRHNPREQYFGRSALIKFDAPTSDTRRLIQAACHGVRGIYRQGPRYAKAGVMLLDISSESERQFSFFSGQENMRLPQLMETVDMLNRIYGRNSVFIGSSETGGEWRMKRDRMTPCYTTKWDEIPVVK